MNFIELMERVSLGYYKYKNMPVRPERPSIQDTSPDGYRHYANLLEQYEKDLKEYNDIVKTLEPANRTEELNKDMAKVTGADKYTNSEDIVEFVVDAMEMDFTTLDEYGRVFLATDMVEDLLNIIEHAKNRIG